MSINILDLFTRFFPEEKNVKLLEIQPVNQQREDSAVVANVVSQQVQMAQQQDTLQHTLQDRKIDIGYVKHGIRPITADMASREEPLSQEFIDSATDLIKQNIADFKKKITDRKVQIVVVSMMETLISAVEQRTKVSDLIKFLNENKKTNLEEKFTRFYNICADFYNKFIQSNEEEQLKRIKGIFDLRIPQGTIEKENLPDIKNGLSFFIKIILEQAQELRKPSVDQEKQQADIEKTTEEPLFDEKKTPLGDTVEMSSVDQQRASATASGQFSNNVDTKEKIKNFILNRIKQEYNSSKYTDEKDEADTIKNLLSNIVTVFFGGGATKILNEGFGFYEINDQNEVYIINEFSNFIEKILEKAKKEQDISFLKTLVPKHQEEIFDSFIFKGSFTSNILSHLLDLIHFASLSLKEFTRQSQTTQKQIPVHSSATAAINPTTISSQNLPSPSQITTDSITQLEGNQFKLTDEQKTRFSLSDQDVLKLETFITEVFEEEKDKIGDIGGYGLMDFVIRMLKQSTLKGASELAGDFIKEKYELLKNKEELPSMNLIYTKLASIIQNSTLTDDNKDKAKKILTDLYNETKLFENLKIKKRILKEELDDIEYHKIEIKFANEFLEKILEEMSNEKQFIVLLKTNIDNMKEIGYANELKPHSDLFTNDFENPFNNTNQQANIVESKLKKLKLVLLFN